MPEEPQHLVSSNPEELEAFEIEPDTLKQMRNACDPITTHFEDFDFIAEALLKPARLSVEKIIGELVEPVVERNQRGIKAFQTTPIDPIDPVGDGARGRLIALPVVKDRPQLFAQVVGLTQTYVHVSADTLDACQQLDRDRSQKGHHPFFLPIWQRAEQRKVIIIALQSDDHDKSAMSFAQRDLIHPDDL